MDPAAGLSRLRGHVGIVGVVAFVAAFWLNHTGRDQTVWFPIANGALVLAAFLHLGLYVAIKRRRGETRHDQRDFF